MCDIAVPEIFATSFFATASPNKDHCRSISSRRSSSRNFLARRVDFIELLFPTIVTSITAEDVLLVRFELTVTNVADRESPLRMIYCPMS